MDCVTNYPKFWYLSKKTAAGAAPAVRRHFPPPPKMFFAFLPFYFFLEGDLSGESEGPVLSDFFYFNDLFSRSLKSFFNMPIKEVSDVRGKKDQVASCNFFLTKFFIF